MSVRNTQNPKPLAVCLLGPTACGKTALAVELVQKERFEIINVDSAQIYRDMDIGTGKPDAATLQRAPHRLLDFLDPACSYSASEFCHDAQREMQDIVDKGRIPLLVGGTMLYFKALRDGLATMPPADPEVRRRIELQAAREGWASVHAQLQQVDPVAAARIHPNDPQRLQRALEVYLVSGETLTSWHGKPQTRAGEFPFRLKFLGLQPAQRSSLHERIAVRFRAMIASGLIDEVRMLYERGDLSLALPSMRSVGYRQAWQYLAGEMPYEAVMEKGIIATRQLAKRQLTWMRSWPDLHNFDSEDSKILEQVLNSFRQDSI